jgi:hypothetical protein
MFRRRVATSCSIAVKIIEGEHLSCDATARWMPGFQGWSGNSASTRSIKSSLRTDAGTPPCLFSTTCQFAKPNRDAAVEQTFVTKLCLVESDGTTGPFVHSRMNCQVSPISDSVSESICNSASSFIENENVDVMRATARSAVSCRQDFRKRSPFPTP